MAITLKAARVNAGYTQGEIAERMGVSNVTISNWEKGKKYPTLIQADALVRLYGITLNDIIIPTKQV